MRSQKEIGFREATQIVRIRLAELTDQRRQVFAERWSFSKKRRLKTLYDQINALLKVWELIEARHEAIKTEEPA